MSGETANDTGFQPGSRADGARSPSRPQLRPSWRIPLAVYGWVQLVLLMWYAARYPALLSPDSLRYVNHVTLGPWTADHSVLYDFLILVSLKLTSNVALITLIQTIVWAAVIAYTVSSLRAFGVPTRWAVFPALLLPFIPSFGAFAVTLWKDVPFAIAEVMLAATTLRLLVWRRSNPIGSMPQHLLVSFELELIALVLFRNDGFLQTTFAAILLVVAFRGLRVKFAALGIGALVAFALAGTVVYPAAGIRGANSSLAYGTFYGDIAVAYSQVPKTFTSSDLALMQEVAPLSTWRGAKNCLSSDSLFAATFNRTAAGVLKSKLRNLWFRVAARNPVLVTGTRLCRSSVAWNPLPPLRSGKGFGETVLKVPATFYGQTRIVPAKILANLAPDPISRELYDVAYHLQLGTNTWWWQVLIWRGAVWCYLAYIALIVAGIRLRRPEVLALGAACLANQLTVLAANPAQLYRYMVGPIFVGMLLVPLLAVSRADTGPQATAPETGATEPPSDPAQDGATQQHTQQ